MCILGRNGNALHAPGTSKINVKDAVNSFNVLSDHT